MNINQINALRKVASAREEAYQLEKEAAFNAQAIKAGLNSAKNAVTGAAKHVSKVYKGGANAGGVTGGLKALGRKAGTYAKKGARVVGNKWDNLSPMGRAGVLGAGGALAGAGIAGLAGRGDDEEQGAAPNFRYR